MLWSLFLCLDVLGQVIALNYNSRQRQLPTCRFEVVRAAHKKQFVSELRGPPQKRSSETAAIVHRDHTSIGSIKASDAGAPCSQQNDERTMLYAFEDDLLMVRDRFFLNFAFQKSLSYFFTTACITIGTHFSSCEPPWLAPEPGSGCGGNQGDRRCGITDEFSE